MRPTAHQAGDFAYGSSRGSGANVTTFLTPPNPGIATKTAFKKHAAHPEHREWPAGSTDDRADVFDSGAILAEILTGLPLFTPPYVDSVARLNSATNNNGDYDLLIAEILPREGEAKMGSRTTPKPTGDAATPQP